MKTKFKLSALFNHSKSLTA